MAYVKNIWVDQDVERPKTYEVTNNQDGSITLTDSFGLVTELGTPVNEVNMNHIEDGIDGCAIRKHNLTETFNLGEWVLGGTGDDEGIYKSLVSNNVGNAITDDTAWEKVELGGSSRNIGEIVASTIPLTDAGLHLLDGALLQYGSYQAFIDYIADLYDGGDYTAIFDTEANWQAEVLATGFCDKYVYDSVNNTVRLPKIGNQLVHNLPSTLGVKGNGMTLGLTDGSINGGLGTTSSSGQLGAVSAFYGQNVGIGTNQNYLGGNLKFGVTSDSSKSGIVAETNNINTADVYYYVVIATTTKTAIQVDIDEIATDLNGKADVDLTNVNNQGTALSTSWMTTDFSYEIRITPPASSSSGSTLANTTLFTAPCNGWVMAEAITNNSSGRFWIFGASSVIFSSEFHGNGSSKISGTFVKKGEQVLLRGAYVSTIVEVIFRPCEGTKWEVQ